MLWVHFSLGQVEEHVELPVEVGGVAQAVVARAGLHEYVDGLPGGEAPEEGDPVGGPVGVVELPHLVLPPLHPVCAEPCNAGAAHAHGAVARVVLAAGEGRYVVGACARGGHGAGGERGRGEGRGNVPCERGGNGVMIFLFFSFKEKL